MLTQCLSNDSNLMSICFFSLNPGLLRTDSGSFDANTTAEEAADKIYQYINTIPIIENGSYIDLS